MSASPLKVIGSGCFIGVAASCLCALYGLMQNLRGLKKGFDDKDFLHARSHKIYNRRGEEVSLRGINLGGWLLQESWMVPNNGEDKVWGNSDTLELLEKRFGSYGAKQLIKSYEDNWITDDDLDYLEALGVNCVRVPFWYRTLYDNEQCKGEPDFTRLDQIVDGCSKRRIYVILDLHGAPGYQSADHSCGKVDSSVLYSSTPAGVKARDRTVRLWMAVAKHFEGNPAVAAYDLLNEPMNGFSLKDKKNKVLWDVYDSLFRAVRTADTAHMITVEGVWELDNLPDPKKYNWTNVVYQLHNYNWSRIEIKAKLLDAKRHSGWKVPLLIGEFQAAGIWEYVLDAYCGAGFSWLTWTYKGAKCCGPNDWFLFYGAPEVADLQNDSYDEIMRKWGAALRTKNSFKQNKALADVLSAHFARTPRRLPAASAGSRPGSGIKVKFGYHIVKGV